MLDHLVVSQVSYDVVVSWVADPQLDHFQVSIVFTLVRFGGFMGGWRVVAVGVIHVINRREAITLIFSLGKVRASTYGLGHRYGWLQLGFVANTGSNSVAGL